MAFSRRFLLFATLTSAGASRLYIEDRVRAAQLDKSVRLLGVATGIRLLGFAMVYPFLALYLKRVVGLGYVEVGALVVLVSILPLAISPFGGLITDRLGRRRVFLPALGGEAAAVLLVAVSMELDSIAGVLVGAALAGVAGSIAQPAIQAYVADLTSIPDRTMAYTWVRIGFNAGFTVGVAAGGVLIGFIGFPGTAFVTAATLASGVVFIFLMIDPSPYDVARSRGAAAPGHGPSVAGPGSLRQSVMTLARDRTFLILCFASLFSGEMYGNWSFTFPLFANTVLLVPYAVLGVALALNGVMVVFGQAPMTKMMTGRKHTYSAVLAVLFMAASFIALGGLSLVSGLAVVSVFAFVVLLTFGENLGSIPSMTLPSNVAPATEIGSYNGVFGLFNGTGSSLTPVIAGVILASIGNHLLVWALLALPGIPALLLYRWAGKRIPAAANRV